VLRGIEREKHDLVAKDPNGHATALELGERQHRHRLGRARRDEIVIADGQARSERGREQSRNEAAHASRRVDRQRAEGERNGLRLARFERTQGDQRI
jgi:hypothetical protein